jgi:hypothetical protein
MCLPLRTSQDVAPGRRWPRCTGGHWCVPVTRRRRSACWPAGPWRQRRGRSARQIGAPRTHRRIRGPSVADLHGYRLAALEARSSAPDRSPAPARHRRGRRARFLIDPEQGPPWWQCSPEDAAPGPGDGAAPAHEVADHQVGPGRMVRTGTLFDDVPGLRSGAGFGCERRRA